MADIDTAIKGLGDGPTSSEDTIADMLSLMDAADLLKGAKRYVPAKVADWHQRQEKLVALIEKHAGASI